MLIQVQYSNRQFDYVKPYLLDDLIDEEKVSKFRRASGWVTIGVDPMRSTRRVSCTN